MPEQTEQDEPYDYIVVGSGAGGGPLAGNLARAGFRVLLLEAGGDAEPVNYTVPVFHSRATEDRRLKWDFFVNHYSEDPAEEERRLDEKFRLEVLPDGTRTTRDPGGILYPRAGTLGGCTAHHAMIIIYPHNSDWDQLAEATGDDTWHSHNMRRYFERLERNQYRWLKRLLYRLFGINRSRHGFDGWLPTNIASPTLGLSSPKLLRLILKAVRKAEPEISPNVFRRLVRYGRWLFTLGDPNDWKQVVKSGRGIRNTPLSTGNGRRAGTREYVRQIQRQYPDFLEIRLHALVTKVVLNDDSPPRAVGVEYQVGENLYQASADPQALDSPPITKTVRCQKEVILCGGTFNTPQLLMLSGIGPPQELGQHDIRVRVPLEGVGKNLQDRYEVGVVSKLKDRFALIDGATFKEPGVGEEPGPGFKAWEEGEGAFTTNGAVISIIKKSDPSRPEPDLFCFGVVGNFYGYFPGYSIEAFKQPYFTWAVLKAHTNNRKGYVRLQSNKPREMPQINFNYFDAGSDTRGEDLEAVVNGIKFVRRLNEATSELIESEIVPGPGVVDDDLGAFVKKAAWGHHACGTCKMGRPDDRTAVVDSRFRVIGTRGLRVVDASIFPKIPGFFIVTSIYMISEKASDVIIGDAHAQ